MTRHVSISIGILAVAGVIAASAGPAAARPDTRRYSCAQNRALIAQYHALIMTTGPYTYARIVASHGFCGPGEGVVVKIVPAADTPHCRIGYICSESVIIHDR